MKIYREITLSMETGEVLAEDSYEYDGPVAECKGGGGGNNEQPETAQEVELSKITQEEWNRFKTTYQPLFEDLAADYTKMGDKEKNAVGGLVHAGTTKVYDAAAKDVTKAAQSRGLDPSSGATTIGLGDVARDRATADTKGINTATSQVDDLKVAGWQNVLGMARGDAGQSIQGLSDIAGDAVTRNAQTAVYNQQARNDTFEGVAGAVGMGMAGLKAGMPKGGASGTSAIDGKPIAAGQPYYNPNEMIG